MTRPDDARGGGEASPEGEERREAVAAGGESDAGTEERGPSDEELIRALEGAIRRVAARLDG